MDEMNAELGIDDEASEVILRQAEVSEREFICSTTVDDIDDFAARLPNLLKELVPQMAVTRLSAGRLERKSWVRRLESVPILAVHRMNGAILLLTKRRSPITGRELRPVPPRKSAKLASMVAACCAPTCLTFPLRPVINVSGERVAYLALMTASGRYSRPRLEVTQRSQHAQVRKAHDRGSGQMLERDSAVQEEIR
ncbi:hypothetical protein [Caballeronia novacaledonica]|uniref:Uncharacterized protein n=1 Tax=Caballeronia novacaledonica TaxID=1544861 RepID=A0AA37IMY5_9BURK|nr:hypothetical protein [Caballeronia novacaledonica]GJH29300.1 hypothetical protein CBA19CS42_32310 [Caballeronia novacaledonica]